jgi:hypothetical protein
MDLIGKTLGDFCIKEKIGSGGMADVYCAWQTRLKRDVAPKVLSPQLVRRPGFQERLAQEAQAAASLNYPHILTTYNYGYDPLTGLAIVSTLENALVLLLRVLAERLDPADACHQRLAKLADELESALSGGAPARPMPSPDAAQPEWDTSVIRALLTAALNDQEITTLCFDLFPPVYDDFSTEMSRGQKIHRLLDYCVRHSQIGKLLSLVRERNPTQYANFEGRLRR